MMFGVFLLTAINPPSTTVLEALFDATNGATHANWDPWRSWFTGDPCVDPAPQGCGMCANCGSCIWVECNSGGDVTKIVADAFGSGGSLPTQIGLLSELTNFAWSRSYLWQNVGISGTIPTQLGLLTKLSSFNMNIAHLSGTIPNEVGSLTTLTDFSVEYNKLSGTIPANMNPTQCNLGREIDDSNSYQMCPLPDTSCTSRFTEECPLPPPVSPPASPAANGAVIELTGAAPKIVFGDVGAPTCEIALSRADSRLESSCTIVDVGRRRMDAEECVSTKEYNVLKTEVSELRQMIEEVKKAKPV